MEVVALFHTSSPTKQFVYATYKQVFLNYHNNYMPFDLPVASTFQVPGPAG